MSTPDGIEIEEIAALNARAARGDSNAASQYLRLVLPSLRAASTRIVRAPLEADDLLGEALVRLLNAWKVGAGPDRHAHAYVLRTVRNLVVDELRSPRSRQHSFPEDDELALSDQATSKTIRDIELASEYSLIREALNDLPLDQRRVLVEAIVHGRKPRDLTMEFERNAAAISNLLKRGKATLHRQTLVRSLLRGDEDCRQNAAAVPRQPRIEWRDHQWGEPGMSHIVDCSTCQKNWARWATIPSVLGVSAGLVVTFAGEPRPASAVQDNPSDQKTRSARTQQGVPTTSWPRLAMGAAGLVLSAAGVFVGIAGLSATTAVSGVRPEGQLEVSAISATALSISLDVEATSSWSADVVAITVSGGTIQDIPPMWACTHLTNSLRCVPAEGPIKATITIDPTSTESAPSYHIEVIGHSGSYDLHGSANGTFPIARMPRNALAGGVRPDVPR
ncbi:sigma-70 family RNA polymerase sigma factor (plasmid) [Microbacterium hominis]|uniref:RNA polymerase sigma factor n=1 Tax=Microbacterium hominis TaxID=162426 RepID=UPI001962C62D|nr:sigma-70 family RNA polymerase sigma factor [Microbacterium hominis]QRY42340.1 sigma-70 family RNA polymerase sigma factor [Microbacterium hominis]